MSSASQGDEAEPSRTAEPDRRGTTDGLRARVMRGLGWKAVSLVTLQTSRLVVALILARLLAPRDFGLAGMVLVFSALVFIFADLGLGSALVQRASITQVDRSTVFWTTTAVGAFLTLVGVGVSGLIADFYDEPQVAALFVGLSLNFVIVAIGSTHTALLNREMRFKRIELLKVAATLVGAIVGVSVAVAGHGAWAIIGQLLAIEVVFALAVWWLCPWRPSFRFSRASLKDLGAFGGNVLGTQLLFFANRNADNLLIGRFLGPASLGTYVLSYNVMLAPFNQIASPLQEVLYPALSRIQDDPRRVASVWVRINRLVGALAIPALAGLAVLAPDFVPVVLGERWHNAIPVIQILTWVGALQSLQRLNSSILQALDRTGALLRFALAGTLAALVAFVVGLHWGIVGIAAGYAIASTFVESAYTWLTSRAMGISPLALVRALSGVVQATIAMVAVLLPARALLVRTETGVAARLVMLIALGAATYLTVVAWRAPALRDELRDLLRRRARTRRDGEPGDAPTSAAAVTRPPWWGSLVAGRRGDLLAVGALLGLCASLAAMTWQSWGDVGRDTGYDSVAASRVADGQLPYVDFTYYYGPLSPIMLGLAMKIGGHGLAPLVTVGLVLAVAIVLATYVLAHQHAGRAGAFLAAAITAPVAFAVDNFSFVLPHTFSATLGVLVTLLCLIALSKATAGGSRRWVMAAGAAAGVSVLTRPEVTLAVGLGCIAWLALRWRAGSGGPREVGWLVVPALAIPFAVYGAFLTKVSPRELVLQNIYPVDALRAAGNAVVRLSAPFTLSSFVELGGRLALYSVAAAGLTLAGAFVGRRRGSAWATSAVALGALTAIAGLAVRPEALRHGLQFAWGWVPAGAAVAVAGLVWRARRNGWRADDAALLAAAVVLAAMAARTYAVYFVHNFPVPVLAVYSIPIAAVLLARLHLRELVRHPKAAAVGGAWLLFLATAGFGLTMRDARAETTVLRGPGGTMTSRPEDGATYQEALAWIARTTRAGESILIAPQLTELYTLSARNDPLREISLLPGALAGDGREAAALLRLKRADVRLALLDQRLFTEYGHTRFGDSFDRSIGDWIKRDFTLKATLGGGSPDARTIQVWVRE